jgi:hypothetical protein
MKYTSCKVICGYELLLMGHDFFLSGAIDSCKCGHIHPWAEKVTGELGDGSFMIGFWTLWGKFPIHF